MDQNPPLESALTRERHIKSLAKLQGMFHSFSLTEKVIFLVASALFAFGSFSLTYKISQHFMVDVPAHGGSLTEGILGTPRFINPLLATSDADRDLSFLVYSGLLKATPEGNFTNDLAESYTVSPDGLVYSFIIKNGAVFHDGMPVTADDIEFTIHKAQDSTLKSPKRINWEGVTVEKKSVREISFTLKQPYAPFIANLTLGILPKHIWKAFESDQFPFSSFNINPVGSGPYKIASVEKSGDGIPQSMILPANSRYTSGEPYISTLDLRIFASDVSLAEALAKGTVESASNLTSTNVAELGSDIHVLRAPFTRVFGVFFNQNSAEILAHKEVRSYLASKVDKEAIIGGVLHGFAREAAGPLPTSAVATTALSSSSTAATTAFTKAGWKLSTSTNIYSLKTKTSTSNLAFSLSTANVPDLVEAARYLEEGWKAAGAQVDVKVFEPSDLNQSVIRPRKYDALLFGMVTGRTPDLYPFWHSSQRNDPGLNIALYTNRKVDALLESMRKTQDGAALADQYAKFEAEIALDTPAVFLWSPDFLYAVPDKLGGIDLSLITLTSDRFLGIEKWYVERDRIWEAFVKDDVDVIETNNNTN